MRSYFFQTEGGRFHPELLSVLDAGTDVSVDGVGMACHRVDIAGVRDFGLGIHADSPSVCRVCRLTIPPHLGHHDARTQPVMGEEKYAGLRVICATPPPGPCRYLQPPRHGWLSHAR